jgi:hypothetical protein
MKERQMQGTLRTIQLIAAAVTFIGASTTPGPLRNPGEGCSGDQMAIAAIEAEGLCNLAEIPCWTFDHCCKTGEGIDDFDAMYGCNDNEPCQQYIGYGNDECPPY